MPIIDISEVKEEQEGVADHLPQDSSTASKGRFFSSMTARLLFLLLLIGDVVWALWSATKLVLLLPIAFATRGKSIKVQRAMQKGWISFKRAGVCGISLMIALFSPALGIMVACTYFLMYDKTGIQEVVPSSLQDQFQEFLQQSK